MFLHLDFLRRDDALYHAVPVDDERGAHGAHVRASVHLLLSPYAELADKRLFSVGYQMERQRVLVNETPVLGFVVDAHSHHLEALRTQLFVVVAQVAGLRRTPGSKVFGVSLRPLKSAVRISLPFSSRPSTSGTLSPMPIICVYVMFIRRKDTANPDKYKTKRRKGFHKSPLRHTTVAK